MKKSLSLIAAIALAFSAMETKAQLADGTVAPNFTFTDMNGNTQDLYTYLNAGKSVVIDVSATWCGPCWSYHNSKNLENFYTQQGPSGTNKAMVIFIEGDGATTNADMNGTGSNTQGNWVSGTPYPMCNPATAQINPFNTAYNIGYFPTMYIICAGDKKTKLVDQYTTAQLVTALNACPVTQVALDAGINGVVSPNGTSCGSTIVPIVKLQNYGLNALTSCKVNYKIDSNPVLTYSWTGNLASGQFVNVTLPSMTTSSGNHTFTSYTSNPNGGADGSPGNDQTIVNFSASTTSASLPFIEGVENATFPPAGWNLTNSDNGVTWSRTTTAHKTGTASMWMDNNNYTTNGAIDIVTSPTLNLAAVGNPNLTFQLAYQLWTNPASSPNWSDTLYIDISTDCGTTWTKIYGKYGTALTTTTPSYASVQFLPNSSQWRLETVSLAPYASSSGALIRFRHVCDYENSLFVDDINITGTVLSVNDMNISSYTIVYPNPSTGDVFVKIGATDLGKADVKITNLMGQTVAESNENSALNMNFDLSRQPNGMYLVDVKTPAGKSIQKVLLNK